MDIDLERFVFQCFLISVKKKFLSLICQLTGISDGDDSSAGISFAGAGAETSGVFFEAVSDFPDFGKGFGSV